MKEIELHWLKANTNIFEDFIDELIFGEDNDDEVLEAKPNF